MPQLPDLSDPRYLDEVGWFLYHEKYARDQFDGGSYVDERKAYSRMLRDEVARYLGREARSLGDKIIVSIGCGCTGDLVAFPGAVKIAIDPLLYTYQQLGMLVDDEAGSPTTYLSVGVENLPLLDDYADLIICRNALDHVPDPAVALKECWRILRRDGSLYISVDVGGLPTPDEPTVFSFESLTSLLAEDFELAAISDQQPAHSRGRPFSLRIVARKKPRTVRALDKEEVLRAYESRLPKH